MTLEQGKYRHFKGNLYEVVDVARCSETLNEMVIYRALYGEYGLWVRPLTMFVQDVQVNGRTLKRFEYLDEACSVVPTA